MPSVEIMGVGTELLLGQLVDTNTSHIAQQLANLGIDVYGTRAVGDNRERITAALRAALRRADGVITTGGLGPTVDDLTKEAVCDALELPTVLNIDAVAWMEELFSRVAGRGPMPENNRKQALLPEGCIVLENPFGSAPGFIAFSRDRKFIACMPGVPREMKPMLASKLLPWLRSQFAVQTISTRILHTIGIAESEIDRRIADLFASLENPKIGVLAHEGKSDVKIMAKAATQEAARALIAPLEREIRARLGDCIFGTDGDTLEGVIIARLQARNRTLALAESCTGGLLCAALTGVPGASRAVLGAIVAYDNSVKIQQLGVESTCITAHGAVSEEVAAAMATGARDRFGASVGISVTGIAGPDGGTPEKPVGLVYLGIADESGVETRQLKFPGDRGFVRMRATAAALGLLWRRVKEAEPNVAPET